ncbi:hypothetical protein FQA47_017580 [Oryzias melastigma]|uniref:Uncharacterized protein n=1 Tax=Oryzias melastigma TaxID=30732 RepID=A0A834CSN1_ORYME|nr:hypothetical protein FQA47_017580 [Oryzias melastigma]
MSSPGRGPRRDATIISSSEYGGCSGGRAGLLGCCGVSSALPGEACCTPGSLSGADSHHPSSVAFQGAGLSLHPSPAPVASPQPPSLMADASR